MNKEILSDELKYKILKEQEEYKQQLLTLPAKEIIDKSYEINAREMIFNVLFYGKFTKYVENELSKIPNPVGCMYDEWIHTEDDIEFSMNDMIETWCGKE